MKDSPAILFIPIQLVFVGGLLFFFFLIYQLFVNYCSSFYFNVLQNNKYNTNRNIVEKFKDRESYLLNYKSFHATIGRVLRHCLQVTSIIYLQTNFFTIEFCKSFPKFLASYQQSLFTN